MHWLRRLYHDYWLTYSDFPLPRSQRLDQDIQSPLVCACAVRIETRSSYAPRSQASSLRAQVSDRPNTPECCRPFSVRARQDWIPPVMLTFGVVLGSQLQYFLNRRSETPLGCIEIDASTTLYFNKVVSITSNTEQGVFTISRAERSYVLKAENQSTLMEWMMRLQSFRDTNLDVNSGAGRVAGRLDSSTDRSQLPRGTPAQFDPSNPFGDAHTLAHGEAESAAPARLQLPPPRQLLR